MSFERARAFPSRKVIGSFMGAFAGFLALSFLIKSYLLWAAIPDGVLSLVGLLGSGWGFYVVSSSVEDRNAKKYGSGGVYDGGEGGGEH